MMDKTNIVNIHPKTTPKAKITSLEPGNWHLEIPAGSSGSYRLAQLDDYSALPRSKFPWNPPVSLSLKARASSHNIPGTWGFGFWNDPFSISLGVRGSERRLPALPHCAWFFMASSPNHLSIYDHIRGEGNLAGVFASLNLPGLIFVPLLALFPMFLIPPVSRLLRKWSRCFIKQDAMPFTLDLKGWHEYQIHWDTSQVNFFLDDREIFETPLTPQGPLGLVIWVDNQFASWMADGKIRMGTIKNPQPAWIELKDLNLLTA